MSEQQGRGHIVHPQPVRETSKLEQLAQWSNRASDEDVDETWREDDEVWVEAAGIEKGTDDGESVRDAEAYTDESGRHLLLLVYATGVQVWRVSPNGHDDAVEEVFNFREPNGVIGARMALSSASADVKRTVVYMVATQEGTKSLLLKVISLQDASTLRTLALPSGVLDFRINLRVVAVACSSPPAIHLYALETLKPLAGSPLLDVPAKPVFALSSSRAIAYASTTPAPAANCIADQGQWRTRSPGRHAVDALDTAQAARRALVSGARAVTDFGAIVFAKKDSYSRSAPPPRTTPTNEKRGTSIKILDLQNLHSVAHFRCSENGVVFLSFDPSGTMVLCGSNEARALQIFEFRGPGRPVWHRYDLRRGATAGIVQGASWSADGKMVVISTARGTAHVYAIAPFGARPDLRMLVSAHQRNLHELPPLSTTVSALARIRPPRFISTACVTPTLVPEGARSPAVMSLPPKGDSRQLALLYPHLGILLFDRIYLVTSDSATTGHSGLSQLLRSRHLTESEERALVQHLSAIALQRTAQWLEVQDRGTAAAAPIVKRLSARYAAEAELQTFSRSVHVNARSLYASPQFEFYRSPAAAGQRIARGDLSMGSAQKLILQRHVDVVRAIDTDHLQDALQREGGNMLSTSPPSFPNAAAGIRGLSIWQRALGSFDSRRSVSTSSPSSNPGSVGFGDRDPCTPATDLVQDEGNGEINWTFDDCDLTLTDQGKMSSTEAPFMMDDHRETDTLPLPSPPREPVKAPSMARERSQGKKKKASRSTPSPNRPSPR